MADEVGVNPGAATAAGHGAQAAADAFAAVPSAFDNAVAGAQAAAVESPLPGAYAAFADVYRQALVAIAQQAQAVGSNVVAGAGAAVSTDNENAAGFSLAGLINFPVGS